MLPAKQRKISPSANARADSVYLRLTVLKQNTPRMRASNAREHTMNNKIYCFGLGEAFAAGEGEAFRAALRASTRARRRVFFDGDGDGDAVSVTAAFSGLGAGVGSAANALDSAISPMAADRTKMCLIILYILISGLWFEWGFSSR